jgi:putative tricarboxylic transport membrane protein
MSNRGNVNNWVLAVGAVVGGCVYLYADSQIPDPVIADPLGPKAFPALIGAGLVLSGLLLSVEAWKKRHAAARIPDMTPGEKRYYLILIGMVVWTVAYYTAFEPVGYVPSTMIYLFGLLMYFNRGRLWVNAVIAICFTGAAYAVFARFLGVSMPAGILS